jgi:hypothetical protein
VRSTGGGSDAEAVGGDPTARTSPPEPPDPHPASTIATSTTATTIDRIDRIDRMGPPLDHGGVIVASARHRDEMVPPHDFDMMTTSSGSGSTGAH